MTKLHLTDAQVELFLLRHEVTVSLEDDAWAGAPAPNEFIDVCHGDDRYMGRLRSHGGLVSWPDKKVTSIVKPRNREQEQALELLHDPRVPLVILTGFAGTGKTLLALSAGKHQLDANKYKKLLVSRPIVPMGRDLGYLPGTVTEKMEPWIAPIRDNLSFLTDSGKKRKESSAKLLRQQFEQGLIEIEAVTYIKGRSLKCAYIIIDEAQNLEASKLKTIITRAGDGAKVVLTGDMDQIDERIDSGLEAVIEAFRNSHLAGHVNLIKGERSELATLASQIL